MRDYATAVAIIDGLENVIVRQVPVSNAGIDKFDSRLDEHLSDFSV